MGCSLALRHALWNTPPNPKLFTMTFAPCKPKQPENGLQWAHKSKQCNKILDDKKYAKNIDEFINDKKPLPNKFEAILLRQDSNILFRINKSRSSLLKESVKSDRSEDIIKNTLLNSSKKISSRSKSKRKGG